MSKSVATLRQHGRRSSRLDLDSPLQDRLEIPKIQLPSGGGALKSIDEKFQVNAANGTASLAIPLPFSKCRSDFAPALTLDYDSGSGNGPCGLEVAQ